jgi:DNA-directed RNA polymerase specialized sigma24 family protein
MQLIYVEGWDNQKIAEHLNISVSMVKKHKSKGIQSLKKKFGISVLLLLTII